MNRLEETNEKSFELRDRGEDYPMIIDDQLLVYCSNYLARLTLRAIGDTFKSAEEIMIWLKKCAATIASIEEPVSWLTPIGFPVIQPYKRTGKSASRSMNGAVTTFDLREPMPVSKQKQVTAFPPNFVHALDSTHMLLTAIECSQREIDFTAVHDSYWTHACDVDDMNFILRECFVQLHSQDVLFDLQRQFKNQYPIKANEFEDPPIIGDLDIELVRESTYFFN